MFRLLLILVSIFLCSPVLSNSMQQLESELKLQQYNRAAQTGLTILRQQPENIQAKFLTAVAFQNNNQPDIAQRYYRQIIESHPELPEPRNNLAMIYMGHEQYDQAIDQLIASLKTHPSYATAWQNLNLLYQGLASEAYRKALSKEKNPRSVMDKIQLSALTRLYEVDTLPVVAPVSKQEAPVTIAATTKQINKPSPQIPVTPTQQPQETSAEELIKLLQKWALAWSNKDFDQYINAYSKNYRGGKPSHKSWIKFRRSRIVKPGTIKIKLSNIQIKSQTQSRAIIDFHQSFKSTTYADNVSKRIHLQNINGSWKITRESTLAVL